MKCPNCGYEMHEKQNNSGQEKQPLNVKYDFGKDYSKLAEPTVESICNPMLKKGFRGYDVHEIDKFLDDVITKINYHSNYDNVQIPFDHNYIGQSKFTQAFRGYDTWQVDEFLDKLEKVIQGLDEIKMRYR